MSNKNHQFMYLPLIAASVVCYSFGVNNGAGSKPMTGVAIESKAIEKESIQVKKNILAFLQWYKKNIRKANSFKMIDYDARGYQFVDKKGCADYLNFIKSSGFISAKYIAYWQQYFDDKALQLKKDKLTKDDVPEGFDFDLVLITQEPELVLDKIDSLQFKTVSLNKSKAVMSVSLPSDGSVLYDFEMQKYSTGWQIDYIATENYD